MIRNLTVALSLAGLALSAVADSPSGEQVIQKEIATFYQAGKDFQAKVAMRLVNAQGSQRERTMNMWRINGAGGDQRYLITFEAPADVRGMGFLVWKYAKKEDDRWLYFFSDHMIFEIFRKLAPALNDRIADFLI